MSRRSTRTGPALLLWAALLITGCSSHDALVQAIDRGDAARVAALIREERSPDVLVKGPFGGLLTPLMIAAGEDSVEVIEVLLSAGANPNRQDKRGWTPLTLACFERKPEIVRVLLAHGADPHLKGPRPTDESSIDTLHRLKKADPQEAEIVRIIAAAASSNARVRPVSTWFDGRGSELLAIAQNENEKTDVLRAYLDLGISPDFSDVRGESLLTHAIRWERLKVARFLLEAGASPQGADARDAAIRAEILRGLKPPMRAMFEEVLAPALSSPAERVAAFDRANAARIKREDEERDRQQREAAAERDRNERAAAARREATAARASREAARRSEEEERRVNAALRECKMPELAPCLRQGKSCEACFHDWVASRQVAPAPISCPAGPRYVACGGVCCGPGYVCCVGATPSNHGAETCRSTAKGCQQGWSAERVK